jgi:class I lanthipeptide synthase
MDHLVVRAPLLPVDAYLALGLPDGPLGAGPAGQVAGTGRDGGGRAAAGSIAPSAPLVRQALAVASPSLLAALDRARPGDPGAARLEAKLLRYLIRMSTRATPFGLFAGVGLARWSDRTELALAGPARTRSRLDMEWLLGLVLRLEAAPEVRRRLRLVANTAAFQRDGRIHLSERAPTGAATGPGADVSVRATGVVRRALALARRPIAYPELAARLLDSTPGASPERVDRLLGQLCEATLLLSDLRPPLTTAEPARWVAERLAAVSAGPGDNPPTAVLDQASRLADLIEAVAQLDKARAVKATAAYPRLTARAAAGGTRARSVLQVDAALDLTGAGLHRAVGEAVAGAAELLLRLSPLPAGPPHLAAYRRALLRRYGPDRAVPLLELLDPRFGLGPLGPANRSPAPGGGTRRHQLLLDLACAALRERRPVLELDDDLVSQLATWSPAPDNAPASLELYVGLAAESAAAVDAGDFTAVLGPAPGASPAGRNVGRFADLLPGLDRAILTRPAVPRPGVVVAELVYLPRRLRQANVALRPARHGHELVVGTSAGVPADRVIPLDELVVGVDSGRLRLCWAAAGVEVEVATGHMLTPAQAPPVCRFLAELGRDGQAQLAGFSWGPAAGFPFLPRVQAGRVVLRPASWRLDPGRQDAGPDGGFAAALRRWRAEWAVPRHVRLGGGDNRLLLDLDDPGQAEQLRAELRAGRPAVLHEAIPDPGMAWLPGPGGRFLTELVVPLSLADPGQPAGPGPRSNGGRTSNPPAGRSPFRRPPLGAGRAERLRPPGSDWLYAKLYGPREDEDGLLAGPVRGLAEAAVRDGHARSWFFLRYSDPDPHLRLRFEGEPRRLINELLPGLCAWAAGLVTAGTRERFALDTYEREIERYGGPEGTAAAEALFDADSRCVAGLLGLAGDNPPAHGLRVPGLPAGNPASGGGTAPRLAREGPALDRVGLAVLTTDDLLAGLGLDPRRRLAWYGGRVADRREAGPEHRRRKAALRPLLADPARLAAAPLGPELLDLLAGRRAALAAVASRLASLAAGGRTVEELAGSFVHLHCNRLLGPDPAAERLVLGLLLRTWESLDRAPVRPGR